MSGVVPGPAAAAALLVVAGLVGLAGRGGWVRLVGPVAVAAADTPPAPDAAARQARWVFLAALAGGALLHRALAGGPAPALALPAPAEALLLVGGGVMVGLGLRLVEGPLSGRGTVHLGPRAAGLAALTALGAGLATAVLGELLLR